MQLRETPQAMADLIAAGYRVVPYPSADNTTTLIVMLGARTVTTLPVQEGGVCEQSVIYLVSEAEAERDPSRHE